MAKTVKLTNPGPASLLVVNPTGGRMRKRRTSPSRTAKRVRRSNPYGGMSRRRATRRRTMRRRNPSGGFGLLTQGLTLAGGGALTQFVTSMVPAIGGYSPMADAARTAGVAYLLGMLAGRLGPLSRFSREITLGGMAVAGGKVISQFILPTAQSVFMPRASEAPANGVKGIGVGYPGLNPYRAYSSGMDGIGIQIPGQYPFGDYADTPSTM